MHWTEQKGEGNRTQKRLGNFGNELFEVNVQVLVKRQIKGNLSRGVKEAKHLDLEEEKNGNHIKRVWKRWFWWLARGAVRAFEVLGRHFSSLDITNSI